MITENVEVRYVPGKFMLADCLTKSANLEYLLKAMKTNQLSTVDVYDAENITLEMIEEAGVDIPLEQLEQARQRPYVPYFLCQNQEESFVNSDSD